MVDVELMVNKEIFDEWLKLAKITQEDLANEFGEDPGNFSKMVNGKIPTPKHVLQKLIGRSLLPHIVVAKIDSNGVMVPINGGK